MKVVQNPAQASCLKGIQFPQFICVHKGNNQHNSREEMQTSMMRQNSARGTGMGQELGMHGPPPAWGNMIRAGADRGPSAMQVRRPCQAVKALPRGHAQLPKISRGEQGRLPVRTRIVVKDRGPRTSADSPGCLSQQLPQLPGTEKPHNGGQARWVGRVLPSVTGACTGPGRKISNPVFCDQATTGLQQARAQCEELLEEYRGGLPAEIAESGRQWALPLLVVFPNSCGLVRNFGFHARFAGTRWQRALLHVPASPTPHCVNKSGRH